MNLLAIATIEFNYHTFVELYEKTNFDISAILWDVLRDNPKREFMVDGISFDIDPPSLMDTKDCEDSVDLFIRVQEGLEEDIYARLETDRDIQRALQRVTVPLELEESCVKYDANEEQFYIPLGKPIPPTMVLGCSFEQTIDDVCWKI